MTPRLVFLEHAPALHRGALLAAPAVWPVVYLPADITDADGATPALVQQLQVRPGWAGLGFLQGTAGRRPG